MKTTEDEHAATPGPPTFRFPVGYYQLHEDPFLNFEMNRPFNRVGDATMLAEMRSMAPKIHTLADGTREFLALAETALSRGETLKAAYYYRSAEFFMPATDPQKQPTRQRFVHLARTCYGIDAAQQLAIPYRDGPLSGILPGYRFTPARPKDTLVIFGGFDSYMEEFIPMAFFFRDAGFDVVLFEGPGQGGALEDAGLPLTHEWEKPVAAVLDHLGLSDVSLMGRSLGGYLVLRAAAFEPRVRRVIADDIIFDFYACILHNVGADDRARFIAALDLKSAAAIAAINAVVEPGAQRSPLVAWNIQQGMHVMGVRTPFEYFQQLRRYSAAEISARVEQDVLLLAASRDHFVPLEMFYRQIEALSQVRSLTARLFTEAEQAQNHCEAGNVGLSLRVIVDWLNLILTREPR
jgi:pimeloyl-ACP methyl ester carboxylesterase